jgi:lactate permease
MFTQILDPTGNLFTTWIVALIPVIALLILLAGLRVSAWLATLIGSVITFLLGLWVWRMPLGDGVKAHLYGSATGIWNVNWITFCGLRSDEIGKLRARARSLPIFKRTTAPGRVDTSRRREI